MHFLHFWLLSADTIYVNVFRMLQLNGFEQLLAPYFCMQVVTKTGPHIPLPFSMNGAYVCMYELTTPVFGGGWVTHLHTFSGLKTAFQHFTITIYVIENLDTAQWLLLVWSIRLFKLFYLQYNKAYDLH